MSSTEIRVAEKEDGLKALFDKAKPSMLAVLPKHVTPERLVKVALSCVARTPKLAECTSGSLLRAVFQAAELGLEAGGLLGEGYLVPYNNKVTLPDGRQVWRKEAQFIVGYRGLVKLARQSGQIASITARVVHEHDDFDFEFGLNERLIHRPCRDEDPGPLVYVYAIATFREGSKQPDVMSKSDVDRVRKRSKSADSGPWVTDYEEMAKKTVIRRLSKLLPLSPELARAVEHDNAVEAGVRSPLGIEMDLLADSDGVVVEESRQQSKADAAREALRGRAEALDRRPEAAPEMSDEERAAAIDRGEP